MNNIFFGTNAYIAVRNIDLAGATDLTLTFGTEKYSSTNGSVFTNSEYHIWLSNDGGTKWVEFTDYTFAGGTTEGRWNVATANMTVPAGTETLSICMAVDVASSYRLDDFKLVAAEAAGTAVDFTGAVEKDFTAGGDEGGNGGGENPQPPVGDGTLMTIAEVLGAGSDALPSGSYIEAVVISNREINNLTSKKGLYVQDATAGLQLRTSDNHEFDFGDKVRVDLSGVTVGEYSGAVQVSVDLGKVSKISSGNAVEAKTVTVADFLANKYEGQYVAIEGVQVVAADLSKTFVMGGAHTSIGLETADGQSFVAFSSKYATYGTETVPQGSGTIKGISSINNGKMQIIFAQTSDYAGLTGERFEGTGGGNEGGDDVTPPTGEGDAVLTFPDGNSQGISSYTDTWSAVSGGYTWTIRNFNNNNNQWAYIKCGRKSDPSVASISVGVGAKVSEVVVTVDNCLDETKVNSAKLIVASDAGFANVVETISGSAAKGTQKFAVSSPAEGLYYKLEYDCAAHGDKNGIIQISKVECVTVK
jgi:hypothetical protein